MDIDLPEDIPDDPGPQIENPDLEVIPYSLI